MVVDDDDGGLAWLCHLSSNRKTSSRDPDVIKIVVCACLVRERLN